MLCCLSEIFSHHRLSAAVFDRMKCIGEFGSPKLQQDTFSHSRWCAAVSRVERRIEGSAGVARVCCFINCSFIFRHVRKKKKNMHQRYCSSKTKAGVKTWLYSLVDMHTVCLEQSTSYTTPHNNRFGKIISFTSCRCRKYCTSLMVCVHRGVFGSKGLHRFPALCAKLAYD